MSKKRSPLMKRRNRYFKKRGELMREMSKYRQKAIQANLAMRKLEREGKGGTKAYQAATERYKMWTGRLATASGRYNRLETAARLGKM